MPRIRKPQIKQRELSDEALPLIRRFYNLGFNIEATSGTARFLKENGIRTRVLRKISDGSDEIPESIRQGHIAYIINTSEVGATRAESDGHKIRQAATENNATIFTLDGKRINKPQKGINIIGGKKVMVK